MVATKLLLGKKEFQDNEVKRRSQGLLERITEAIRVLYPSAPGAAFLGNAFSWAHGIVQLKQMLMLNPQAYRIYFCIPGMQYDSSWMQAVGKDGFDRNDGRCIQMKVRMCLFPALAEQPETTLSGDETIHQALVSYKPFFPSRQERSAFNPRHAISKAVVLLE
jgi:hypothetical protein